MRIMSRPPSRIGKQNQQSQFIEVTSIEKTLAKFQQQTKISRKATSEQTFISVFAVHVTFTSSRQEHWPRQGNSSPWEAAWQIYGQESNMRGKEVHRMNKGSNFLGSNFSNRDNVSGPIQDRRERLHQITQDYTSQTKLFPTLKSTSDFLPQFSLLKIRFKFSSHLQLLPHIRCLFTLRVENSIISIDPGVSGNLVVKSNWLLKMALVLRQLNPIHKKGL